MHSSKPYSGLIVDSSSVIGLPFMLSSRLSGAKVLELLSAQLQVYLLLVFWPYSVFGQNHLCVMMR
jgi:hypothetical protein